MCDLKQLPAAGSPRPRSGWTIAPALALLLAGRLAFGQTTPCDPELLRQSTANPHAYRQRGERCEGIYVQQVAGAPLAIVSWTQSFSDYDLSSRQPLTLQWDRAPDAASVRLRANSLQRRLYYRMDAIASAGATGFTWPSEILVALGVASNDIGVTATTRLKVGDMERDVHLPLRIAQGKPAQAGSYRLVVLPGGELSEVFVSLSLESGGRSAVVQRAEPLRHGYYPAGRPIEVLISSASARGFYHLEIGASTLSGGAATTDIWFYHPG
jgi:hypothetical protein